VGSGVCGAVGCVRRVGAARSIVLGGGRPRAGRRPLLLAAAPDTKMGERWAAAVLSPANRARCLSSLFSRLSALPTTPTARRWPPPAFPSMSADSGGGVGPQSALRARRATSPDPASRARALFRNPFRVSEGVGWPAASGAPPTNKPMPHPPLLQRATAPPALPDFDAEELTANKREWVDRHRAQGQGRGGNSAGPGGEGGRLPLADHFLVIVRESGVVGRVAGGVRRIRPPPFLSPLRASRRATWPPRTPRSSRPRGRPRRRHPGRGRLRRGGRRAQGRCARRAATGWSTGARRKRGRWRPPCPRASYLRTLMRASAPCPPMSPGLRSRTASLWRERVSERAALRAPRARRRARRPSS